MEIESEEVSPLQLTLAYRNLLPKASKREEQVLNLAKQKEATAGEKGERKTSLASNGPLSSSEDLKNCSIESKKLIHQKKVRYSKPSREVFSKTDLRILISVLPQTSTSKSRLPDESSKGLPVDCVLESNFTFARPTCNSTKHDDQATITRLLRESIFNLKRNHKVRFCPNGDFYVGDWHQVHKKHGVGIFVWKDGSRLAGKWHQNAISGFGKYVGADGSIYAGHWERGLSKGVGEYRNSEGYIYRGEWANDLQEGMGEEFWSNGDTYRGQFQGGKKHGQGKMTFDDGSVYEGHFVENRIAGYGKFASNFYTLKGKWKEGGLTGSTEFEWSNGAKFTGKIHERTKRLTGVFIDSASRPTQLSDAPYADLWSLAPQIT